MSIESTRDDIAFIRGENIGTRTNAQSGGATEIGSATEGGGVTVSGAPPAVATATATATATAKTTTTTATATDVGQLTSAARDELVYQELAGRFRRIFDRIAEQTVERERSRTLPFEQVRWLNDAGFGAIRVPLEWGGAGATLEHLIRLLIELAEADSNIAHLYRAQFGFVESLALADRNRQERWYPRIVAGAIFGNASTEASGAAIGDSTTRLSRTEGGWVVTGRKFYSTGSLFADWIMATASADGADGRYWAIVSTADPGVELIDDWDGFGQPLTGTGTTILTEARVDPADVSPRVDGAAAGQAFAQLYLLAVLAGIGKAALGDVATLVGTRKRGFNTGNNLLSREDPQILQVVGEVSSKAHTAAITVVAAAREFDATEHVVASEATATSETTATSDAATRRYLRRTLAVDRAQTIVPELVMSATQQLFDALGASSTGRDQALDRHWRNARTIATHNPRVYKARLVGAHEVTGAVPEGLWGIGDVPRRARSAG